MDNQEQKGKKTAKNRFLMGALVGALCTVLVAVAILGGLGLYLVRGGSFGANDPFAAESSDGKLDFSKMKSKMTMLQELIDRYFLYDEDTEQVQEYVYKGLMAGLDDPYSEYYTVEEFQEMQEDTEGVYSGIGAMLSQNQTTGLCTVVRVFEGSPAEEAGMKPGDVLYKVEGELVAGESLSVLVSKYIKGEEGSQVTVTVYRQESDEYVDLTMTRRSIEVPTVEHQMMADQIGYILITQFDQVTADQFKAAVDDLESQGMKGLVLDLRSNPGGVLDGAVSIADYLLPDDLTEYAQGEATTMITYTADKNGKGDHYTASDHHSVAVPIAVLVNGNSASASEVLTGALKDYKWATVVGTTSYGKGIVQSVIPLADGSAVKLTIAHYYTPSGFDLHGKGITPDVTVELDENLRSQASVSLEEDNQVQKAVEVVKENRG